MSLFTKSIFLLAICSFIACGEPSDNTATQSSTNQQSQQQKPKAKKKKPAPAKKFYYTSERHGFTILQPAGWEVLKDQNKNLPIAFINRAQGASSSGAESIGIAVEEIGNSTLNDYYEFSRDQLINMGGVDTGSIIEESTGTSAQGQAFKRIIFNRTANQKTNTVVSFLYFHNNKGYTVTCSSMVQKFNKMRGFFEETGMSIKFQ